MYYPKRTNQFKKDYRLCTKRNYDMSLIDKSMTRLCETGKLPDIYFPYLLKGACLGYYECHIKPDWLMI